MHIDRRELLKLLGLGGVVLGSGLPGFSLAAGKGKGAEDFFFLQLSDTHWGFSGPPNPEATRTLQQVVQAVNATKAKPDFIVFTGDLTHTTDDDALRRKRMGEFQRHRLRPQGAEGLLPPRRARRLAGQGPGLPGALRGPHHSFHHKGVHFIALDNVSDPSGAVGDTQIDWLKSELGKVDKDAPIVVLTHRPLFDLYPQWDWATADGAKVISVLEPYRHLTVFYGHIHQENHRMTGHIAHHSAKSLMFPLPAPGSVPKRQPIPWDPEHPARGLGYREVEVAAKDGGVKLEEYDVKGARV